MASLSLSAATSVLSYHYDSSSTGVNSTETALTPANVHDNVFTKQYSTPVDGQVYAQVLYVPSVVVTGGAQAGTHNLAFVATQHDSLYAIDVNSGVIVWQDSFSTLALAQPGATACTSVPVADLNCQDTAPEVGICGTPVIDGATNMLFVAAKTKQVFGNASAPHYLYTLYKIDITNGNTGNANIVASTTIANTTWLTSSSSYVYPTANSPTAAQDPFVYGTGDGAITVNGTSRVYFNAMRQMNRPGMMLNNGTLWLAFGSHGDNGPYHGWMMNFNESTLALTAAINLTPNGGLGGFWGGGAKPVIDSTGAVYMMIGNGAFDGYALGSGGVGGLDSLGFPINGDYGMSMVKIIADPTTSIGNQNKNGWGLKVADYFTPYNEAALNSADTDLGSGGVVLLPTSCGNATHPNLAIGSGKQGTLYLVDITTGTNNTMGKFSPTTDNVVTTATSQGSSFSTPAFFNGSLYPLFVQNNGHTFVISNAAMKFINVQTPDSFAWPGSTPTISANGTSNAILWGLEHTTSQLRAYDATNLANELWTSGDLSSDNLGVVTKFTTPTVADGRVLVGTTTALVVYGPPTPPLTPPAAPTNLVASPISSLEIDLSWTDNASNEAGFSIEKSTDGVNFSPIATVGVNITSFPVQSGLQGSTTYYFRVRAYNSLAGTTYSAYTNIANATTTGAAPAVNFPNGFASTTGLYWTGSTAFVNNRAELTNAAGSNEAGTLWAAGVQNVQRFVTSFNFQITNPIGDGFTFCIQNQGQYASGVPGGCLGYLPINNSVAIKFDIFNNSGEGTSSTGIYTNGAIPTVPSIDLTPSHINLLSGDIFSVTLSYDGTTLTEKVTDTVTGATQTNTYAINIPTTIGSNTAYVGFTGGTGGATALQDILSWTYSPLPTTAPAAPTGLVATAVSGTQVNLNWVDNSNNESGFLIMRSDPSTNTFAQVGVTTAGATTYTDTGLSPNITYTYEVAATNNVGNSAYTNTSTVTTPIPPATPTGAQATSVTQTTISMSWNDNSNNETGFNVLRKATTASNFSQVAQLPANTTSYTDTNLTPGTSYDYHIQAYNLAGYSDFSGFTAVTLATNNLPIVTVASTGPVAINGLVTGAVTFASNAAAGASGLSIAYTVTGSAVPGADYVAVTGSTTIAAGATSVTVPITAMAGSTQNATFGASIATTSTYTAGTPAGATVVMEPSAYNATAGTAYGTSNVAGTAGNSVTLSFPGLPGNPSGAVYVWYLNGTAFTTTTSSSYTITNAITGQSGIYSVYAWAPGGTTGSASFNVTISPLTLTLSTSTQALTVNDGATGSFTASLSAAPTSNVTVSVAVAGTPDITVSPATITMTPTSYQNIPVTVTAASINSNDSNRTATVTLTAGTSTATVNVTDAISDAQTAANLTATAYPLTGANIGTGSAGDSSVRASGLWWVDGSGTGGVAGSADSFHYESQSFTGNFQMIVNLQNLVASGATSPLAGLMVRDGTAAGSNFLALAGQAATNGAYSLVQRTTVNGAATQANTTTTYTYPAAWMMLTRVGNVLHAFTSSDGNTFTEVTNPTNGVTWTNMSAAVSVGVFSSSTSTVNARAVMTNFSVIAPATFTDADIGNPALAGSATVTPGTYTVKGGGADIWNASDQFNYYSEPLTGNETLITHVRSVQGTSSSAKGGVMFRNSNAANSAFVGLYCAPNRTYYLQWRDVAGGACGSSAQLGNTVNLKWLKLVKSGTTYSAYYAITTATPVSTDWTLITTHTTTFTNTTFLGGLAVTAHDNTLLCTSIFDVLTVTSP